MLKAKYIQDVSIMSLRRKQYDPCPKGTLKSSYKKKKKSSYVGHFKVILYIFQEYFSSIQCPGSITV